MERLIEAVRPGGTTPPKELRGTIPAIFWRHRNGAKWRSLPGELGPWWLAAQLFIRWYSSAGIYPLGQTGCLGAPVRADPTARDRTRHGVYRWPEHSRAAQGGGREKRGSAAASEII